MSTRRNRLALPVLALGLAAGLALPAGAAAAAPGPAASTQGSFDHRFPDTIPLPDGFQPEGVAIGSLPFAYFGSLADGSIYRANLFTGKGKIIGQGPGTSSVGMKVDRGRLYVAGGDAGDARVVSAFSGKVMASYQLASGESFVNDVVLTHDAAWFTDSVNPVLYRVSRDHRHGPADSGEVTSVELTGDLAYQEGFNVNGISRTPDGKGLLVIQSNTGLLFRVDPDTGETTEVDLGGETLPNGDGILLRGRTLYVVQNQLNQVAVVRLDRAGTSGTVVDQLTDPRFDVPTTVAAFGNRLYLPNARFGTEPTPSTTYSAVGISAH